MKVLVLFISILLAENCIAQKNLIQNKNKPAPEITLEFIYNKPDSIIPTLKSLKGKVVVLDFWATWCSPCVAAMPKLNRLSQEYKDKVQFIGITDDPVNKIENFLKKKPLKYWIGIDKDGLDFKNYGIQGRPTVVIINQEGFLVYKGYDINKELLDEVLTTETIVVQKKPKATAQLKVKDFYGSWAPGEDPLYNGVNYILRQKENRVKPISQFIIRPSLLESKNSGYGMMKRGNYVGITMLNLQLPEIVVFLNNLSSEVWVNNLSKDTTHYDIIYAQKGKNKNEVLGFIKNELEKSLSLKINEVNKEKDVNILYLKNKNKDVVSSNKIPSGAEKLYIPVSSYISVLEKKTGKMFLADKPLNNLYVFDNKLDYNLLYASSADEIIHFLAKKGITIQAEKRRIETFEIK